MNDVQIQIPPADVNYIRRKWLDIPYAHISQSQKLDIDLPEAEIALTLRSNPGKGRQP